MYAYQEAMRQYQESGFVSDEIRAQLSPEALLRAYEEACR